MFVEEKKQGEPQGPSLAGFISWLEQQPAERQYCWGDNGHCACAQYARSIDQYNNWIGRFEPVGDYVMWRWLNRIAYGSHTFGQVLARAKAGEAEFV
jgi:hypothetical protein